MNKFITLALLSSLASFAASSAFAEVGGDVKMNVKTGAVIQTNTGIANKNVANLGAVSANVGGDVKTNVTTGVIYQSNKGIANSNELSIGSVTDPR